MSMCIQETRETIGLNIHDSLGKCDERQAGVGKLIHFLTNLFRYQPIRTCISFIGFSLDVYGIVSSWLHRFALFFLFLWIVCFFQITFYYENLIEPHNFYEVQASRIIPTACIFEKCFSNMSRIGSYVVLWIDRFENNQRIVWGAFWRSKKQMW